MASNVLRSSLRIATRSIVRSSVGIKSSDAPSLTHSMAVFSKNEANNIERRIPGLAFFSSNDDSHNDFAPKRTVVDGDDEAIEMIKVR